jgi:hypothetical protein
MEVFMTIFSTVLVQVGLCMFCFLKKTRFKESSEIHDQTQLQTSLYS